VVYNASHRAGQLRENIPTHAVMCEYILGKATYTQRIRQTFSEHSGTIQRTFRDHSGNSHFHLKLIGYGPTTLLPRVKPPERSSIGLMGWGGSQPG
jgi:hypothetical protein